MIRNGSRGSRHCTNGAPRKSRAETAGVTLIRAIVAALLIAVFGSILFAMLYHPPHSEGGATVAIGTLRTLAVVQSQFREEDLEQDGHLDFATSLAELSQAGLIDPVIGSGTRSGYVFSLSGSTDEWECSATPLSSSSDKWNFIICTDGMVRYARTDAADCSSPPIE